MFALDPPETHLEISNLLAKKFIARHDVKAIQKTDGTYAPRRSRFTRDDLLNHLNGTQTHGHYLLNLENNVKLIVFDIDLGNKDPERAKGTGVDRLGFIPSKYSDEEGWTDFYETDLRQVWQQAPSADNKVQRGFLAYQMRMMGNMIARAAHQCLGVPIALSYTGSKGVHVYAFTGLVPAELAQSGQQLVFASLSDKIEQVRGNSFYRHVWDNATDPDPFNSYRQLTIEAYPKQSEISEDSFGNLVRLPLGKNMKNPGHPTFFLDARAPYSKTNALIPRSAIDALTHDNPWE